MQRVYVITHPEASHHVENRVGGWFDSRLTAAGLQRAKQIARYLRALIPFTETVQLVSSDLRSAEQDRRRSRCATYSTWIWHLTRTCARSPMVLLVTNHRPGSTNDSCFRLRSVTASTTMKVLKVVKLSDSGSVVPTGQSPDLTPPRQPTALSSPMPEQQAG